MSSQGAALSYKEKKTCKICADISTIYRRLLIVRDGHLDQSDAYDYRNLYENTSRPLNRT